LANKLVEVLGVNVKSLEGSEGSSTSSDSEKSSDAPSLNVNLYIKNIKSPNDRMKVMSAIKKVCGLESLIAACQKYTIRKQKHPFIGCRFEAQSRVLLTDVIRTKN